MQERNHNHNMDPWDENSYGTGSTKPPKSYGGIIALLLGCVIFLGGIISAMNMLNIRLMNHSSKKPDDSNQPVISSEPIETLKNIPNDSDVIELNPTDHSQDSGIQPGGLSLQEIYEKNIASVVSIVCAGPDFSASGTGVVLSSNGYLVTNAHVVENAVSTEVLFTDQRKLPAELVGIDPVSDLAVLHVQAQDLIPAEFGDSSILRVGDSVAAIGDPLGIELRGTMTNGIVSAINRDITLNGRTMTLIQTNAALNSGNSGGPLINSYGQVIGINTMKIGDSVSAAGVEGLGFAIPSTTVKQIVDQLISQGYVSGRPSLGFTGESVSRLYQIYYGLPAGVYITQVDDNSDAARLGISQGDILLSMDGIRITDADELHYHLFAYHAGDTVKIKLFRNGKQYTLQLVLEEATG